MSIRMSTTISFTIKSNGFNQKKEEERRWEKNGNLQLKLFGRIYYTEKWSTLIMSSSNGHGFDHSFNERGSMPSIQI